MTITDKDIDSLIRYLREQATRTNPYVIRESVLKVAYAVEEWLKEMRDQTANPSLVEE